MNALSPLRDLLTLRGLTPAEAKIAQGLLGDYPVAGLGTPTALAASELSERYWTLY